MTAVDFHTGVADKLGYGCRLLRKAWRAGNRVLVTGAPEQLARLDKLLWTFDVNDFIPHLRLRDGEPPPELLARSPIWLCDEGTPLPAQAGEFTVRVNLGPAPVDDAESFARVIELIGESAEEVAAGRQRWRQYLVAGLKPVNHAQGGQ